MELNVTLFHTNVIGVDGGRQRGVGRGAARENAGLILVFPFLAYIQIGHTMVFWGLDKAAIDHKQHSTCMRACICYIWCMYGMNMKWPYHILK